VSEWPSARAQRVLAALERIGWTLNRDHAPPHFHARYGGREVLIAMQDPSVLDGGLPPRALGLVMEWAALHQDELQRVWEQARSQEPLDAISPLE
jgi:hypothetical protein